ncbi:MAG: hypothetical protein ACOYNY_02785 [Caldilineaceae bacterium]|jgi:hypothetical protein
MAETHERLMARIQELPEVALPELALYVDFLHWKARSAKPIGEMPVIDDDAALVEEAAETLASTPRFLHLQEEARNEYA